MILTFSIDELFVWQNSRDSRHKKNWNNEIVYKSSFPQKFQVQMHSRKSGQLACRRGI